MQREFVTYKLALRLEQLGFKEKCLSFYNRPTNGNVCVSHHMNINGIDKEKIDAHEILAPLWQQVFDWFFKEYEIHGQTSIISGRWHYFIRRKQNEWNIEFPTKDIFINNYEARKACLEEMIRIVENKE